MDNNAIILNVCQVETAIILVQFAQNADARHVSNFGF